MTTKEGEKSDPLVLLATTKGTPGQKTNRVEKKKESESGQQPHAWWP